MPGDVIVNQGDEPSPGNLTETPATSVAEVAAAVSQEATATIAGAVALQQLANDSANPEILAAIREVGSKVDTLSARVDALGGVTVEAAAAVVGAVEEAAEEDEERDEETAEEISEIPEAVEESTEQAIEEIPAIEQRQKRNRFWL